MITSPRSNKTAVIAPCDRHQPDQKYIKLEYNQGATSLKVSMTRDIVVTMGRFFFIRPVPGTVYT